jgi:flagellar operon protein
MIESITPIRARENAEPARFKAPAHPVAAKFASVLRQSMPPSEEVRFSAHAAQRLQDRDIPFSEQDTQRLSQSIAEAEAKGAKTSLILMDRLALIVGVPNRTVITVMEPQSGDHTVFTNIDSVVVAAKDDAGTGGTKTKGLDPFQGSPFVANR